MVGDVLHARTDLDLNAAASFVELRDGAERFRRVRASHGIAHAPLGFLLGERESVERGFLLGNGRLAIPLQAAEAFEVFDELLLGHVLAREEGPPFGLGAAAVEIEEVVDELIEWGSRLRGNDTIRGDDT